MAGGDDKFKRLNTEIPRWRERCCSRGEAEGGGEGVGYSGAAGEEQRVERVSGWAEGVAGYTDDKWWRW